MDVFCMLEILRSPSFRNSPETEDTGNIFMLSSIRSLLFSVYSLISNEVSASLCLKILNFLF
jgi:hypothetical protein